MSAPHIWVRAEQRENEARVGLMPEGAAALIAAGFKVTVEASETRAIAAKSFVNAGCAVAASGSWVDAPKSAIIFGLKELPEDGTPLVHRHIMFGHAYKAQGAARALLDRFKAGGGTLLDLEYLVNDTGRRVAAFGYWAGFAGAAVSLMCWAAQQNGQSAGPVSPYVDADALKKELSKTLSDTGKAPPRALIIGALGRVGTGAADLCRAMNVAVTGWDMEQTAHGGPFPEILERELFFNCILAGPKTPVFVRPNAPDAARTLRVIGDIACDPDSEYNPVQVYDRATTWANPALRVHDAPPLDVMAIDNLPSMLPRESSADFSAQLLPSLMDLAADKAGVWARARATFDAHV
jgi:saccharopine dehydrogenase (NAD+, L-lysine-forming)